MVAVIHCILNHNARDREVARYPGINHDVVAVLRKHKVGVIQMPCPEMTCLGLPRTRGPNESIRDVLDTPKGRSCCRKLSISVADTIEEFQRHGYTVAAVLGGDVGSPGCAVPYPQPEASAPVGGNIWGVFTGALLDELRRRGIEIPFRGIRDSAWETMMEDINCLDRLLAG
jgi:predicted secreted protein